MTTQTQSFGVTTESQALADILAGDHPLVTESILLAPGSGTLPRGQVLGQLTKDTIAIDADDGNTGAADAEGATITLGALAQVGDYVLTCTTAGSSGGGVFQAMAPDGSLLPPLTAGAAYAGDHINGTIPEGDGGGTADWALGDLITISVSGSGAYAPYDDTPAAYDGREVASRILAEAVTLDDTDDTAATAYRTGLFRSAALTGIDAAGVADLDALGIFVRT